MHAIMNAAALLIYGPAVERIFTRSGFWIVYVLGGACASLASLVWRLSRYGEGASLSIGASGAIFALGGALIVSAIRVRHRLAPGRARALGAAILFLLLPGLASGFERIGTDGVAHAGGLVAGAGLGAILPLSPRLAGASIPPALRALGAVSALALALSLGRVLFG
jgi:rhomboid protease GluP